jgi:muconolactone delta-isomerase
MSTSQTISQNFVVEMQLKPIPPDAYQELGHAEIEYTKEQIAAGRLTQLLVTNDHKRYWMVYAVGDEAELLAVLQGFPFHSYFDYSYYSVMDMVEASKAGMTDPNLD